MNTSECFKDECKPLSGLQARQNKDLEPDFDAIKPRNVLKRCARIGLISFGLLVVAGCAQTGDFGRARQAPGGWFSPSPTVQASETRILAKTDEEREMSQRVYRFTSLNPDQSWLATIIRTARINSKPPRPEDYYTWLRAGEYASSRARYGRLLNDIEFDVLTLPDVFSAICAVQEMDRRRAVALTGLRQPDPEARGAQALRKSENDNEIDGLIRALEFRYSAYSYALEQLLVETPHEQARAVDDKLNGLGTQVERARASQFCAPATPSSPVQL